MQTRVRSSFRFLGRAALIAFAVATTVVSQAAARQESLTIAGSVVDSRSGNPLGGAVVHIRGTDIAAVTDAVGEFRLSGIAAGAYTLSVSRTGFGPRNFRFDAQPEQVRDGAVNVGSIGLQVSNDPLVTVTGVVRDAATGEPVPQVPVDLNGQVVAVTDANGSFRVVTGTVEPDGTNHVDNDVGVTEFSVGFATAVDVATQALDMLQPTAASHSRVMILEVMGRDAGHIAIAAGIAGGADIVLIPEIDYKLDAVAAKIDRIRQGGRNFALCVVAEAVKGENGSPVTRIAAEGNTNYGGIGGDLADRIAQATGAETRVTVLGHVQRGAPPSPQDRIIGQAFGVAAVDAVDAGKSDRIVIWQNRNIMDISIADAIAAPGRVDLDGIMVRTARGLDICLGDK